MRHSNEDHEAYRKDAAEIARRKAVAEWLQNNPHIGALSNGTYYKIVAGQQVAVQELSGEA